MPGKSKTYLNWSSGKDAAYAYFILKNDPAFQVDKLLTTVNEEFQRVTMHGLRIELLERQAVEIGLPLQKMVMPSNPSMDTYEIEMKKAVDLIKGEQYETAAFGDINLQDLRDYRDTQLNGMGIQTHYPLWNIPTRELAEEIIDAGFKARIVALNEEFLSPELAGAEFDRYFLKHLPDNVDPCGENGEFHTFCYDGPIFTSPIQCRVGEKLLREYPSPKEKDTTSRIWFADLLPQ